VTLTALVGLYLLIQYLRRPGPARADSLAFGAVYGFLLLVVVGVSALVSCAVGLRSAAFLWRR
jgi:uncharacterized membrane protein YhfC